MVTIKFEVAPHALFTVLDAIINRNQSKEFSKFDCFVSKEDGLLYIYVTGYKAETIEEESHYYNQPRPFNLKR